MLADVMVPKDAIHTRAKRASLHIDPTSFHGLDASTSQSPRASATSQSPSTPVDDSRPSSSGSDLPKSEEEKAPALGPIRTESTAHNRKERERRKRSRVTPDQLVHLEQFFAVERSPTATRRKEISDMLGMEERQTQVWFQNRWENFWLKKYDKAHLSSGEPRPSYSRRRRRNSRWASRHRMHQRSCQKGCSPRWLLYFMKTPVCPLAVALGIHSSLRDQPSPLSRAQIYPWATGVVLPLPVSSMTLLPTFVSPSVS